MMTHNKVCLTDPNWRRPCLQVHKHDSVASAYFTKKMHPDKSSINLLCFMEIQEVYLCVSVCIIQSLIVTHSSPHRRSDFSSEKKIEEEVLMIPTRLPNTCWTLGSFTFVYFHQDCGRVTPHEAEPHFKHAPVTRSSIQTTPLQSGG